MKGRFYRPFLFTVFSRVVVTENFNLVCFVKAFNVTTVRITVWKNAIRESTIFSREFEYSNRSTIYGYSCRGTVGITKRIINNITTAICWYGKSGDIVPDQCVLVIQLTS